MNQLKGMDHGAVLNKRYNPMMQQLSDLQCKQAERDFKHWKAKDQKDSRQQMLFDLGQQVKYKG